jgi:hypothetical protein
MTTETIKTHDEAQIQQLIADKANAICAEDLDRIMATTPQMLSSSMRNRRSKSEVQMPSVAFKRRDCHTSWPSSAQKRGTSQRPREQRRRGYPYSRVTLELFYPPPGFIVTKSKLNDFSR